ncbi:hypothetical protein D9613_008178 [Agrocybe pediades]|uniref:Uncharacterized protein n=1 Tax=Agrocybe pediades TaxID=84607 RepID=A0A8H4QNH1_9AGAR|nr:hypothetical protein D9613_008178 [Agrocybe pediades]
MAVSSLVVVLGVSSSGWGLELGSTLQTPWLLHVRSTGLIHAMEWALLAMQASSAPIPHRGCRTHGLLDPILKDNCDASAAYMKLHPV